MPEPADNGQLSFSTVSKHETCFLHGTLFIMIKSASNLGRSGSADEALGTKHDFAYKLGHGARFVGKKMLNAVRATNNVWDSPVPCSGAFFPHHAAVSVHSQALSQPIAFTPGRRDDDHPPQPRERTARYSCTAYCAPLTHVADGVMHDVHSQSQPSMCTSAHLSHAHLLQSCVMRAAERVLPQCRPPSGW